MPMQIEYKSFVVICRILLPHLTRVYSNACIKLGISRDRLILMNLINICLRQNLHINEADYIAKHPN